MSSSVSVETVMRTPGSEATRKRAPGATAQPDCRSFYHGTGLVGDRYPHVHAAAAVGGDAAFRERVDQPVPASAVRLRHRRPVHRALGPQPGHGPLQQQAHPAGAQPLLPRTWSTVTGSPVRTATRRSGP